jgi:hypothetical protein
MCFRLGWPRLPEGYEGNRLGSPQRGAGGEASRKASAGARGRSAPYGRIDVSALSG